jgi:hypothetical protein
VAANHWRSTESKRVISEQMRDDDLISLAQCTQQRILKLMKKAYLIALPFVLLACSEGARDQSPPAPEAAAPVTLPDPANPESFIGVPLALAQAAADEAEIPHRVVEVDGEPLPRTKDHRPERLNFTVVDGRITAVIKG